MDRPVGMLQTYLVADYPAYAELIGISDSTTAGADILIGEEDLTGRGLGTEVLRRFVADVVFARPETTACVADPDERNIASVRAFEKAGFHVERTFVDPDDGQTHALVRLDSSRRPERAEVGDRVARLPAPEEALDRRMEDDLVQLDGREQAVPLHGRILGAHGLERPAREVGREDDVDDVLRRERARGRDGVDDRHRPLERHLAVEAELLPQLAAQRLHEALSGVDAAAGQQPVLAAVLLVPAEQDAVAPAQDCGHANARLEHHDPRQPPEEPKPAAPRTVSGSSSSTMTSTSGTGVTTSCAMRMPASTVNGRSRSVLRAITRSSPR